MGLNEDVRAAEDAAADDVIDQYVRQITQEVVDESGGAGTPGPPNVLTIGTVTTGAPGSAAAATITGTSPAQVLNLTIPQGQKGDPGSGGGGVVVNQGLRQIDDFDGATDADKLASFLSYAAAQTYAPYGQFPARLFDLGSRTYAVPQGMKLVGAGAGLGPKNSEQGKRNVAGEVKSNAGLGDKSTFVFTGNVFGTTVFGIAFALGGGTQLFDSAGGNVYSAEFNSLTIYGGKHAFGNPDRKFLNTFCHFTGINTAVAMQGQFGHFGGSDSWFYVGGRINLGAHQGTDFAGKPLLVFNGQSKSYAGGIYDTSDQNARPLVVKGGDMDFDGGVYEGYKDNDPCMGTAIRVEGGYHSFRAQRFAYVMRNPGADEKGVIDVLSGQVSIDNVKYDRGSTSASVPLVTVRGGHVDVTRAKGFGFTPVVKREGGSVSVDGSVELVGGVGTRDRRTSRYTDPGEGSDPYFPHPAPTPYGEGTE